jgi:hypothetical protein
MTQVKGTAIQSSLRYVRERFGAAAVDGILRALPADKGGLLKGSILVSAWYPLETLIEYMKEAERQLGAQAPELLYDMGKASCDHGVTGVYKVFFKVGSPEFVTSRSARVFSSYYDTGDLRLLESRDGYSCVEILGLEPSTPQLCARLHGWLHRTLELAGAKNVRSTHSSCVHRGDPVCRFEGTWDPRG